MGRPKGSKNFSKEFCLKGHKILETLKNSFGQCNPCYIEWMGDENRNLKLKMICPKGHDIFTYGRETSGGGCRECGRLKHVPPLIKKSVKQFCPKGHDMFVVGRSGNYCKECKKITDKEYNKKNKEKIDANKRKYVIEHPEVGRKAKNKYSKQHPEIRIKYKTNRNLRIVKFGQEGLREFILSKPIGMVVDHIVPLCGKKVSGLNVLWNLQYLTPRVNGQKGNRCILLEVSDWYGKLLENSGLK